MAKQKGGNGSGVTKRQSPESLQMMQRAQKAKQRAKFEARPNRFGYSKFMPPLTPVVMEQAVAQAPSKPCIRLVVDGKVTRTWDNLRTASEIEARQYAHLVKNWGYPREVEIETWSLECEHVVLISHLKLS